ncbi:unnamed protein product [Mytilus coruscus]|uniref:Reverse transcriptase domain-containing protein n=1 Tax=Mytilus coruscus TaxID=42192 RepID=A0A6J8CEL8_MYTCO|nr:unnamed protein product [Mytilus coruscus]
MNCNFHDIQKTDEDNIVTMNRVNWEKCDTLKYQSILNEKLKSLDIASGTLDEQFQNVADIFKTSAEESSVAVKKRRVRKLKPWPTNLRNAKNRKKKTFVAFIDASKAFDVVWHDSLMLKLFQSGIKDEDWFLVYKWYQQMRSRVKWDGQFSRAFDEQQGVRQGGILSPTMYKIYINPLLDRSVYTEISRSRFNKNKVSAICPSCLDGIEDTEHFLLQCSSTDIVMNPFITKLRTLLYDIDHEIGNLVFSNKSMLLRVILDMSSPQVQILIQTILLMEKIEAISRGMVYASHHKRCSILDLVSN